LLIIVCCALESRRANGSFGVRILVLRAGKALRGTGQVVVGVHGARHTRCGPVGGAVRPLGALLAVVIRKVDTSDLDHPNERSILKVAKAVVFDVHPAKGVDASGEWESDGDEIGCETYFCHCRFSVDLEVDSIIKRNLALFGVDTEREGDVTSRGGDVDVEFKHGGLGVGDVAGPETGPLQIPLGPSVVGCQSSCSVIVPEPISVELEVRGPLVPRVGSVSTANAEGSSLANGAIRGAHWQVGARRTGGSARKIVYWWRSRDATRAVGIRFEVVDEVACVV
jgi:hypothetical protein